ncbi:MAG: hypothetical protein JOZ38_05400 [Candidatus Eremiobacteraeota bacterium]|nr:hypothetical protein [Candidatus Eremiobacteraeota bacterium]
MRPQHARIFIVLALLASAAACSGGSGSALPDRTQTDTSRNAMGCTVMTYADRRSAQCVTIVTPPPPPGAIIPTDPPCNGCEEVTTPVGGGGWDLWKGDGKSWNYEDRATGGPPEFVNPGTRG